MVTGSQARGVEAISQTGSPVEIDSPLVIVAAGTINTPLLLARSGLGGDSGRRSYGECTCYSFICRFFAAFFGEISA